MARLASILAHVLASTALLACGGRVNDEIPNGNTGASRNTSTSGASRAGGSSSGQIPPTPPDPVDAGSACEREFLHHSEYSSCSDYWHLPCGAPEGVTVEDGLSDAECQQLCGAAGSPGCNVYARPDLPGFSFECFTCVEGRRPEGYEEPTQDGTIAGWLAHAADLERVSIDAFQILRRELLHHGAPRALIEGTRLAEADEVRHARALGALARREGAFVSGLPVKHGPIRSLLAIALENAVEGCIRETYGALVAGWQAQHATRLDVRRAMQSIYRDETAHAELAWNVHTWMMERLTSTERFEVEAAMVRAVAELRRAAAARIPAELIGALGLPPPDHARRLVAGLDLHLWGQDRPAA